MIMNGTGATAAAWVIGYGVHVLFLGIDHTWYGCKNELD